MILDVLCIITSCLIRNSTDAVSETIKKQIFKRYINLYEASIPKQNKLYSTFSDRDAMRRILAEERSV